MNKYLRFILIIIFFSLCQETITADVIFDAEAEEEPDIHVESVEENDLTTEKQKIQELIISELEKNFEQKKVDTILFSNNDCFNGFLQSIEQEGQIQWKGETNTSPISFKKENVCAITLHSKTIPSKIRNNAIFYMNDGYYFMGELVSFSPQETVINTSFASQLTINSQILHSIFPITYQDQKTFIAGFGPKSSWKKIYGGADITIDNNGLQLPRGNLFTKEINFPEMFQCSFTVQKDHQGGETFINLMENSEMENLYFQFSYTTQIGLKSYKKQEIIYSRPTHVLQEGRDELNFTVFVNQGKKQIIVYLDKKEIGRSTGTINFKAFPRISFGNISSQSMLIKKFSVKNWDGHNTFQFASPKLSKKLDHDIIFTQKKEIVSGNIKSITQNEVLLESNFGILKIPFSDIEKICFSKQYNQSSVNNPNDIFILLNNSGVIKIQLESVKDEIIHGMSDYAGKIQIPLSFVKSIIFNVHK